MKITYQSSQETKCAGCGIIKHTPLRRDEMGGYVCLTCIDKQLDSLDEASKLLHGFFPKGKEHGSLFYGKDCPNGMVQVEFVGCDPKLRIGEYGWKPTKRAFLEIYIDGQRFRIEVGDYHDGQAQRRGLHIVGPMDMVLQKTACNAASIFLLNTSSSKSQNSKPDIFYPDQKVRALVELRNDLREDGMGVEHCADKGDILVVRKVNSGYKFCINVSHEGVSDRSFCCAPEEIEPLSVEQ